jgi:replicative DNA helicase
MDRPPQISRAMRRLFRPDQREHLAEHLVVRGGPPPADFARHPDTLLRLCRQVGADTVVVDSIKDSTIGLASDEVGAGYNAARQRALAGGVEVLELHHQRKANGDNKQPDKLADVYGSTWITAGAGSVVMLWGEAGDPIVALSHLKQPAEPVGPLMVLHDHVAGTSAIYHQTDLLSATRSQGAVGMNALIAAKLLFTTDTPTASEREKARRKLDAMVRAGLLVLVAGSSGGAAGGTAGAYFLAERNR